MDIFFSHSCNSSYHVYLGGTQQGIGIKLIYCSTQLNLIPTPPKPTPLQTQQKWPLDPIQSYNNNNEGTPIGVFCFCNTVRLRPEIVIKLTRKKDPTSLNCFLQIFVLGSSWQVTRQENANWSISFMSSLSY